MKELLTASTTRRVFATAIDNTIVSIAVLPVVILFQGGHLLYFVLFLAASCLYYVKCPMYQSLGQKIAKIRITMDSNKAVTAKVIFHRTLSQFLCPSIELLLLQIISIFDNVYVVVSALVLHILVTLFWIGWYLMGLFSPTTKTMHDLLLGTTVVVSLPSPK